MQCKTERGGSVGLKHKILQPLGVTKFPLRGNKKVSRARLKTKRKKTGEGNNIAGMEKLYPFDNNSLCEWQKAKDKRQKTIEEE